MWDPLIAPHDPYGTGRPVTDDADFVRTGPKHDHRIQVSFASFDVKLPYSRVSFLAPIDAQDDPRGAVKLLKARVMVSERAIRPVRPSGTVKVLPVAFLTPARGLRKKGLRASDLFGRPQPRWVQSSDENRHGEMAADVLLSALARNWLDRVEFGIDCRNRKDRDENVLAIKFAA